MSPHELLEEAHICVRMAWLYFGDHEDNDDILGAARAAAANVGVDLNKVQRYMAEQQPGLSPRWALWHIAESMRRGADSVAAAEERAAREFDNVTPADIIGPAAP